MESYTLIFFVKVVWSYYGVYFHPLFILFSWKVATFSGIFYKY